MRYALILAGGSGVRLWPVSRKSRPKQLLPLFGNKSLLELALERLEGLIPAERRIVCAGLCHREAILNALPQVTPACFLGEPEGRDTLNAAGFCAAVLALQDPDAVVGVFTADHLIEPADHFREIVSRGYALVEDSPQTLVTFGVEPTFASTGYGYLQLGEPLAAGARRVEQFKEKPDAELARQYFEAGPQRYLWNSGMFVWRASTLLDCIRRFCPPNYEGLMRLAGHWDQPGRDEVLCEVYPRLPKISVDYAVMEPASRDSQVQVAAIPMPLRWLDVGSWATFALTRPTDASGNAIAAETHLADRSEGNLLVSEDPAHLIAVLGCQDLIVVHTADATLVCPRHIAESVKQLQEKVAKVFGGKYI